MKRTSRKIKNPLLNSPDSIKNTLEKNNDELYKKFFEEINDLSNKFKKDSQSDFEDFDNLKGIYEDVKSKLKEIIKEKTNEISNFSIFSKEKINLIETQEKNKKNELENNKKNVLTKLDHEKKKIADFNVFFLNSKKKNEELFSKIQILNDFIILEWKITETFWSHFDSYYQKIGLNINKLMEDSDKLKEIIEFIAKGNSNC